MPLLLQQTIGRFVARMQYPGAKIEAGATRALKEFGGDGAGYRTPDRMAKVGAFYKKTDRLQA